MIREVDEFDQGNYTCQINTEPVQSKVVTLQVEGRNGQIEDCVSLKIVRID